MPDRKSIGLYDPSLTYQENLERGPFGGFANPQPYQNSGKPSYDFFGSQVFSPFGIAAGPLPGARFVEAAFHKGFDIVTFKSVRTDSYPCHPAPNLMPVDLKELNPHQTDRPIAASDHYDSPISLANSYGIPSVPPAVWQPEIKRALATAGPGQAMLVAFQGTDRGEGRTAFIDDHLRGVGLLKETGAPVVEINLSCPNEGSSELLCFDVATTEEIVRQVRQAVPGLKLLVKTTYFTDHEQLRSFAQKVGPLVDGIVAINTVGARVVNAAGEQAFPGTAARAKPGISGRPIKHLTLDMTKRLNQHRQELGLDYKIVAVGGVQTAADFQALRDAGSDIVLSVTGAMWNPELAAEIKASL